MTCSLGLLFLSVQDALGESTTTVSWDSSTSVEFAVSMFALGALVSWATIIIVKVCIEADTTRITKPLNYEGYLHIARILRDEDQASQSKSVEFKQEWSSEEIDQEDGCTCADGDDDDCPRHTFLKSYRQLQEAALTSRREKKEVDTKVHISAKFYSLIVQVFDRDKLEKMYEPEDMDRHYEQEYNLVSKKQSDVRDLEDAERTEIPVSVVTEMEATLMFAEKLDQVSLDDLTQFRDVSQSIVDRWTMIVDELDTYRDTKQFEIVQPELEMVELKMRELEEAIVEADAYIQEIKYQRFMKRQVKSRPEPDLRRKAKRVLHTHVQNCKHCKHLLPGKDRDAANYCNDIHELIGRLAEEAQASRSDEYLITQCKKPSPPESHRCKKKEFY